MIGEVVQTMWRAVLVAAATSVAVAILGIGSGLVSRPAAAQDAIPIPTDLQLRVGDTATLDGGALQVSLVKVEEDSRCPANVMCVWAGRAVVRLHATVDGTDRGEVTASLYPGRPRQQPSDLDAVVDRYVLSLTGLQPYPMAGQDQPADQEVATIRVRLGTDTASAPASVPGSDAEDSPAPKAP
jgi:hypothetical protein